VFYKVHRDFICKKKKEDIKPSLLYHQLNLFTPLERIFYSQRYKELKDLDIIRDFEWKVKGLTKTKATVPSGAVQRSSQTITLVKNDVAIPIFPVVSLI
jgi:hypothetical protein